MEKFLTNLIIKIAFGKGMVFKPEIRQIIEQLVTMAILIGCMAGTAISVIIALLVYLT